MDKENEKPARIALYNIFAGCYFFMRTCANNL